MTKWRRRIGTKRETTTSLVTHSESGKNLIETTKRVGNYELYRMGGHVTGNVEMQGTALTCTTLQALVVICKNSLNSFIEITINTGTSAFWPTYIMLWLKLVFNWTHIDSRGLLHTHWNSEILRRYLPAFMITIADNQILCNVGDVPFKHLWLLMDRVSRTANLPGQITGLRTKLTFYISFDLFVYLMSNFPTYFGNIWKRN